MFSLFNCGAFYFIRISCTRPHELKVIKGPLLQVVEIIEDENIQQPSKDKWFASL